MSKWCEKCDNSLEHCTCKKATEGECDHKYVFDGLEDGFRRYKCHECKDTYLDERAN